MVGLDEGRRGRRCLGLAHGEARASAPNWGSSLGQFFEPAGSRRHSGGEGTSSGVLPPLSATVERPTQNWHGQGESDCLIKTKHCDGRKSVLTQCDFCPVL